MRLRFAWCAGPIVLACLFGAPVAVRAEAPPLVEWLADAPADSLVRQMTPGPGLGLVLPGAEADAVAGRLQIDAAKDRVTLTDPVSGLSLVETRQGLPDLRAVVRRTTLANRGPQAAAVSGVALADWTFRLGDASDAGYQKLTYRNDTWYGSTYWTGPDWTRVGKNWHHPGVNTPAVRRFTAPADGRVTITGRVFKLHAAPSDGVRLAIRHGTETVWQAEIDGADTQGVEPSLSLEVRAGDAIRFVVHKRGEIYCDTTHWDPVIAYADGRRFQASQAFSTTRQGEGGWWYEMQCDGPVERGLPQVRFFDSDFALRECALRPGQNVAVVGGDALPMLVLSDGADQSGIVLALGSASPWRWLASLGPDNRLRVQLIVAPGKGDLSVPPGGSIDLPPLVVAAYRGRWLAGMHAIETLLASSQTDAALAALKAQVNGAMDGARGKMPRELDYWAMIQAEWRQEDKLEEKETAESYARAAARHLDLAGKLLDDLRREHGAGFLAGEAAELEQLRQQTPGEKSSLDDWRQAYYGVRRLKRHIALSNPLMQFGRLLFCKRVPTSYSHLVMQYYGWRARPGGGLFVLERPGYSLAARDILEGQLSGGNVLEPRLSYDARRVVFSWVDAQKSYDPGPLVNDADDGFYHVYEVGVDGAGLRQLTRGPFDDLMPTWLPDGGIAFSSTRRRGYARCFGGQFSRRWHVYGLHRMEGDGSNLHAISFHDTNEWFPAVTHSGHILYARWDYIDRDAVTHQNLWTTRPDGTNPAVVWGNATSSPHCSFQAQPIPGSQKIIFTASAHHSITGGSIVILDPAAGYDGHGAITRITPEIPFPEAESRDIREYYDAPWPLSERYYLVAYSPKPLAWEPSANDADALGIYLLDALGNRELIYRDPAIGSTNPCPLAPRPTPPVLASLLPDDPPPTGEMLVADVYRGLGPLKRGSITQLRVVQILPKTTNVANSPPIGLAGEENGRAILGTVPVEPDGSARFVVPAGKPILFQALDQDGFAYQTMRSVTYVQPGERVACIGCHENRMTAPAGRGLMALRRAASPIEPGPLGGRPFSFVHDVQPILDKHCVRCHGGEKTEAKLDLSGTPHQAFTRSYVSLCGDANFWGEGTNPQNAARALVPRYGARNQVQVTLPGGMYGSLGSRLMKLLRTGHENVQLAPDDLRTLAAWIDLNAIFYGVSLPDDQARQLRGELVAMPEVQ